MNKLTRPFFVTLVLFAGMLSSCNAKSNKPDAPVEADPAAQAATQPAVTENPNWKTTPGLYAVINTGKGDIVCELEFKKAPVTVASFVGLAEGTINNTFRKPGEPYFDGLTFHRVEPGFVIQGGDPKGNGSGNPGYFFNNEIVADLKHNRAGTLAMANAGPNTNGSQFYITFRETANLDGHYNVFGYVVFGMNVVQQVQVGEKINSIKIVRVGADAQAFNAAKTFEGHSIDAKKMQEQQEKEMEDKKAAFKKQYAQQIAQTVAANAGYQAEWDKKVKEKYPTAKKTSTGLYYIITDQGKGPRAEQFKNVKVHYTGTLWNGKKFDSSLDRGQPLPLMLGVGKVIPGWDEGIALLNQGGKAKLIIPFYLAYGDQAMGNDIPAKSDLIFDVEVVEVTN